MSQSERIVFIAHALSEKRPLTAQALQDRFEISRATAMRDIEFLRNRFRMPIEYDAGTMSYRLATDPGNHAPRSIPGLWLGPGEAYAFLTLYNVARAFDPGALGAFLDPFRDVIKQFMSDSGFRVRGFDEKISIDIPFDPPLTGRAFSGLSHAMADGTPVRLKGTRPDGRPFKGAYLIQKMILRLDGWWARLASEQGETDAFEVNARDIEIVWRDDGED